MKNLIYLSAAALAALSLAACSSDNDVAQDVNPTYDGKSVKTQFAISIGSGSQGTRMSANTVQENNNFRGINAIRVAAIKDDWSTNTPTNVDTWINLSEITGITTSDSKKVYNDIAVPVGTKSFLFYGTASLGEGTKGNELGSTKSTFSATLSEIKFEPNAIASSLGSTATGFVNALNSIANAIPTDANELKSTFLTGNAGSSSAILQRVQSLVTYVNDANNSVSDEAKNAINNLWDTTNGNEHVKAVFTNTGISGNSANQLGLTETYKDFPKSLGLPDGAALLTINESAQSGPFSYSPNGSIGNTSDKYVPVATIDYPAELMYYCASPVKASDTELKEANKWSSTPSTWKTNPSGIETGDTHYISTWDEAVKASSKTIAIANNINYGVAQLQTKVKAAGTTLEAKAPVTDNNQDIAISDFKLTGILVGGQPTSVGYNFLPKMTSGTGMTSVIYDNVLSSDDAAVISGVDFHSTPDIYTLVYDSYVDGFTVTNFALEFLYSGNNPIKGIDGIIYKGMKFYLLGRLDSSTNTETINWSSIQTTDGKWFPKYDTKRVFIQDFRTLANVTINSLHNAYIGIPDLRSSVMSFGLSVDLTWKSGLTFDVIIN